MKNSSLKKYFIPALLIVIAAFNLVLFLVKSSNWTVTFWFTYGFIMLAFLLMIVVVFSAQENKTGVAYIHPTVTLTALYLFVVFTFGVIMLFFPKVHLLAVAIPLIILTAIFFIIYLFASVNKAIISREDAPKSRMFKMADVPEVLDRIMSLVREQVLLKQLDELKGLAIKASGFNEPNLEEIDERIFGYIQFIEKNARRHELNNIYNNIKSVKELFKEREKRLP